MAGLTDLSRQHKDLEPTRCQHDTEPLPNIRCQPITGSPLGLQSAAFQPATPLGGVIGSPYNDQSSLIFTSDNVFQRHGLQEIQIEGNHTQDTLFKDTRSNIEESLSIHLSQIYIYNPAMGPPRFAKPRFRESILLKQFYRQDTQ